MWCPQHRGALPFPRGCGSPPWHGSKRGQMLKDQQKRQEQAQCGGKAVCPLRVCFGRRPIGAGRTEGLQVSGQSRQLPSARAGKAGGEEKREPEMPCSIQFPGERREKVPAAPWDGQAPDSSLGSRGLYAPNFCRLPRTPWLPLHRGLGSAHLTHSPGTAASQLLLFSISFSFFPLFLWLGQLLAYP